MSKRVMIQQQDISNLKHGLVDGYSSTISGLWSSSWLAREASHDNSFITPVLVFQVRENDRKISVNTTAPLVHVCIAIVKKMELFGH